MQPDRFLTHSLQDQRIARVLNAALEGVDPAVLVARHLSNLALPPHRRRFLLGLGKAAENMTRAAADTVGTFEAALVITKQQSHKARPRTTVLQAGHPVPDRRSLDAGHAALHFVSQLKADDLLICLISGGGSALAAAPVAGVSLEDLQALTSAALASGANIESINVLRRQLDKVKGGGLVSGTNASVISLILSDVKGDRLEAIASGPTAPNPTGSKEALEILERFSIPVSASMERALKVGKPDGTPQAFGRVRNLIVGNGALAMTSAMRQANREGFAAEILDTRIQGEAQAVGRSLATRLAQACRTMARPFCILAAGEATVTLGAHHGRGGRNQEIALAAVDILDSISDCMLVSLATDGNDGPTDAAGAVVTGASRSRAAQLGMLASKHLARHDAYPFFDALEDLLKPGYTGTNVNDVILLLGL
ncbi:MAG: DUF4147 domain-containing protein [Chloroflexota bacterium]